MRIPLVPDRHTATIHSDVRERADIVIVGAGAAGLMTAIWAGRTNPARTIVLLDGAKVIGAKILVAGGGRCNVTHDEVDERAYAGSTRPAIAKVLRRFDVPRTAAFFRELGVELKREETGKLFPVTDDAHTVLEALLREVERVGASLRHPRRVTGVERTDDGFIVRGDWGSLACASLVLATGGKALPKSGSDGAGYALAQTLGHTVTPRVFPALVPLVLESGHFLRELSGVSFPATLEVRSSRGTRLASFTNSMLCTHFGLSGPAVLDVSRYFTGAKAGDPGATLVMNLLPGETEHSLDHLLLANPSQNVGRVLAGRLPERVLKAAVSHANVDSGAVISTIRRDVRRHLVQTLVSLVLPVTGDRGFTHAEVTAGGVPLSEIRLESMESRRCPGLHLVGEICDVDGRIGGFNFQWAWASGYVAGASIGGT